MSPVKHFSQILEQTLRLAYDGGGFSSLPFDDRIPSLVSKILEKMNLAPEQPRFFFFDKDDATVFFLKKNCVVILVGKIGEGGFKTVKKGFLASENAREGIQLAVAIEMEPHDARISDEFTCSQEIQKRPIRGIAEVFETTLAEMPNGKYHRVYLHPFYNGGDLHNYVTRLKMHQLDSSKLERRNIQYQLIRALIALAKRGYIHRDLKQENVVLHHRPNGTTRVLVIDFGHMKNTQSPTFSDVAPCQGSIPYLPPEIAELAILWKCLPEGETKNQERRRVVTPKLDVWGIGSILLSIENKDLFLNIFCQKKNDKRNPVIVCIRESLDSEFPEPEDKDSVLHLIWLMLRRDPQERVPPNRELEERFCSSVLKELDHDANLSSRSEETPPTHSR